MNKSLRVSIDTNIRNWVLVLGIGLSSITLHDSQAQSDGVCARVGLRLDQNAVMTRTAFRATLEISNHDPASPLTSVAAQIEIKNAAGQVVTSFFQIETPTLVNVDRVDGAGTIPANATATIRWLLIPSDLAAPTNATDFYVGGQFSYALNGLQSQVPLEPMKITVYPDAALDLTYFHQREVLADDPFTPQVEPSIPYVLAVMVKNRGAGAAKSLKITSGQPQIISNDKGLLIDFQLVGASLNGTNAPGSLALDFGQIDPGGVEIAQWYFTSSLLGFFRDFSATFQHEDTLGDIHLSTIKSISIHELTHLVEASYAFADGKPDFLVNDAADPDNLPDTLYLSDGTTNPVQVVQQATIVGVLSQTNLQVQLGASMPAGWTYLRVPDPSGGQFVLAGVRRADGAVIKVGTNAWTTDRVFPGPGLRPIVTNLLHLLDYNSPGVYTLQYAVPRAQDTTPPISSVGALPALSYPQFPVTWSGSDEAGGSGLASFDIYVSTDGGPFQPWLQTTMLRGAIYSGSVGSHYAFYSVATDIAGNREAAHGTPDAQTTVLLTNQPPVLDVVADQTINEGTTLSLALHASDPDGSANELTYSLGFGTPPGMTLNSVSGILTWPTGEADGPSTNNITVFVRDNGSPSLSATQTFRLVVNEVNMPPTLASVPDQTVAALTQLKIGNSASDTDIPANVLSYQLLNQPSGSVIDNLGVITWTPTLAQAPSTNLITTVVTDNGVPPLSATNSLRVFVKVPNRAPVLAPIADRTINVGERLWITNSATDVDVPAQKLTYSIGAGAPTGMVINANTGLLNWRPSIDQADTTNGISAIVSDNGVPSMSATQSFTVTVLRISIPTVVSVSSTNVSPGDSNILHLALASSAPITNLMFNIHADESRLTNFALQSILSGIAHSSLQRLSPNLFQVAFAPAANQPFAGTTPLCDLGFRTVLNTQSAVVPLEISEVQAIRSDGSAQTNVSGTSGRVFIIGDQPILEALLTSNQSRLLALYGKLTWSYGIEYETNLIPNGSWTFLSEVQMTSQRMEIADTGPNAPAIFYRAHELSSPPTLSTTLVSNQIHLTLCGVAGKTYVIEYSTNRTTSAPWLFLAEIPLHTNCQDLGNLGTNSTPLFYRAVEPTNSLRLLAMFSTDQTRKVVLCGEPGKTYGVEFKTNLVISTPWTFLAEVVQTNYCQDLGNTGPSSPTIFYRAYEKIPFRLLQMRRQGTDYVIEWPTDYLGCILEEATALSPNAVWMPSSAVIQQFGDKFQATVPVSAAGRFYRLSCGL